MCRTLRFSARMAAVLLVATPALPAGLVAQDFLFGPPKGSFGIRGGVHFARAAGDVFDFTTEHLTLDRRDFAAATFGVDLALRAGSRLETVFGAGFSRVTRPSEFRHFVDEDDLPIEQRTELTQLPLTAGLRLYLVSPGRSIGRFAWVPNAVAPYVGGGGGLVHYRFEQSGDFVAYEDLRIFREVFVATGWAPLAQALGGFDVRLGPRTVFTTEARYSWASGDPGLDFEGFRSLDLSGLQTTVGVSWRF